MIPLTRWFEDQQSHLPDRPDQDGVGASGPAQEDSSAREIEARIAEACAKARQEAMELAEARVEAVRESERRDHVQALDAVEAQWAERCSLLLNDAIESARDGLKSWLGQSVATSLRPFLAAQAAARAATMIIELLDREMAAQEDPVFEIRAPLELHAAIEQGLRGKGAAVAFTEAERIELVSRSGVSRFEMMADEWIAALEEERLEQ